jgi:hypothetical protein
MTVPATERIRQMDLTSDYLTSLHGAQRHTCAVCARVKLRNKCRSVSLDDLKNSRLLQPTEGQDLHGHTLTNGMLLNASGVAVSGKYWYICEDCAGALESGNLPEMAMVGSWDIGLVPEELSYLTLTETLLITRRIQVIHRISFHIPLEHRPNSSVDVIPFRDKHNHIVENAELPFSAEVLNTILELDFGDTNPFVSPDLEHLIVRRNVVDSALQWLKANNPVYRNIVINHTNIALLPDRGLPYGTDTHVAARHSKSPFAGL